MISTATFGQQNLTTFRGNSQPGSTLSAEVTFRGNLQQGSTLSGVVVDFVDHFTQQAPFVPVELKLYAGQIN